MEKLFNALSQILCNSKQSFHPFRIYYQTICLFLGFFFFKLSDGQGEIRVRRMRLQHGMGWTVQFSVNCTIKVMISLARLCVFSTWEAHGFTRVEGLGKEGNDKWRHFMNSHSFTERNNNPSRSFTHLFTSIRRSCKMEEVGRRRLCRTVGRGFRGRPVCSVSRLHPDKLQRIEIVRVIWRNSPRTFTFLRQPRFQINPFFHDSLWKDGWD